MDNFLSIFSLFFHNKNIKVLYTYVNKITTNKTTTIMTLLELMPYIATQVSAKYTTALVNLIKDIPTIPFSGATVISEFIIFYITKDGEVGYELTYDTDDVDQVSINVENGIYSNCEVIEMYQDDIDSEFESNTIEVSETDSNCKTVISTLFSC